MEVTRLFLGTPTHFVALLMILELDLTPNFGVPLIDGNSIPVFSESLDLKFSFPGTQSGVLCIKKLPDGNSHLRLMARDEDWPAVKAWWDLIDQELISQGLISGPNSVN